jgi:hypothetical protein
MSGLLPKQQSSIIPMCFLSTLPLPKLVPRLLKELFQIVAKALRRGNAATLSKRAEGNVGVTI